MTEILGNYRARAIAVRRVLEKQLENEEANSPLMLGLLDSLLIERFRTRLKELEECVAAIEKQIAVEQQGPEGPAYTHAFTEAQNILANYRILKSAQLRDPRCRGLDVEIIKDLQTINSNKCREKHILSER